MLRSAPPLVTVVIPTRGRAELVARAVKSALAQTYPSVEVIVVVDGPDRLTVERLEGLAEPRLRIVALAENVGGGEARNIGIREARGAWIAMLDDDDEWFAEKLSVQMAARPVPPTPYCLVTCWRIERQSGYRDVVAPRRAPYPGEDVSEYMFYPEDSRHHICGPQTSSFLATWELFLDVPFTKGLKCHQDWDWYLRAMHHEGTTAVMVEDALYLMDVETERPRMTQVAKWQLSRDWVVSRRDLFTDRAFRSFLINECMFRLEQTRGRTRIFRELVSLCRSSGELMNREIVAIVKWYCFRPSVRLKVRRLRNQTAGFISGITGAWKFVVPATRKQEVHH